MTSSPKKRSRRRGLFAVGGSRLGWRWGEGEADQTRWLLTFPSAARERIAAVEKRMYSGLEEAYDQYKTQLPLLDSVYVHSIRPDLFIGEWSYRKAVSQQIILWADLDELDETVCPDWDMLRRSLLDDPELSNAVVLRSPSGKIKIGWWIQNPSRLHPDSRAGEGHYHDALIALLPSHLRKMRDARPHAMYRVFFTLEMIDSFKAQFNRLKPAGNLIDLAAAGRKILQEEAEQARRETKKKLYQPVADWPRYRGALPAALLKLNKRSRSKTKTDDGQIKRGQATDWERFLRLLLGSPRDSHGIRRVSHQRIAKRVGVATTQISRWIDRLIEEGHLKLVSRGSIIKGSDEAGTDNINMASEYQFLDYLDQIRCSEQLRTSSEPDLTPCADGTFHDRVLRLLRFATSEQELFDLAAQIADLDAKSDRRAQIRRIWRIKK